MQLRVKDETIFFSLFEISDIFVSTRRLNYGTLWVAREISGKTEGHCRYNKSNFMDSNRYCFCFDNVKTNKGIVMYTFTKLSDKNREDVINILISMWRMEPPLSLRKKSAILISTG